MELGSELAKGVTERMVGIQLPIFMRIVLPGFAATGVLYTPTIRLLGYLPSDDDHWWQRIAGYLVLVFFLGAIISTLGGQIYKIFEGRSFWPAAVSEWGRRWQQSRVVRLLAAQEAARGKSEARFNELWNQLRSYPTNEQGNPEATHPTELGNLLAAYEAYPDSRYGMDSVFYWTRIWLQIDKDTKAEIDSGWSLADGFLTLSAISAAGGIIWIGQSILAGFDVGTSMMPFSPATQVFFAGLGWMAIGYFWYRLSLPFHRENGEVYKAIFDIYREKVWTLTQLKPREKRLWSAAWAYLQYALLKCPNCDTGYNPVAADKCASCGFGLSELKRNFPESGEFPPPP
jgi:hypothetical protein